MPNFLDDLFEFEDSEEKSRESYVRAPFAWPGGKFDSLKYILPVIPKGERFIEACGGSGVISLNLHHDYLLKVFNDRHSGITSFYRCLKDSTKRDAIRKWLELTCHSREEFIWCRDTWENVQDDVERASRWYYMLRCSFAGLGRNWARVTNGKAQHGNAMHNGLELFDVAHRAFKGTQIENLDVCQCIKDYDGPGAVFYVDPDYIGTDVGIYKHKAQHKTMLDLIFDAKGWFAVSSYKNELYESYAWDERLEWPVQTTMRAKAFKGNGLEGKENVMGGGDTATEVLYIREFR